MANKETALMDELEFGANFDLDVDGLGDVDLRKAMAASQLRLAAIREEEQKEIDWGMKLYRRYQVLQDDFLGRMGIKDPSIPPDGRSVYNPEKNLKISAVRAYGWAKHANCNADEARRR